MYSSHHQGWNWRQWQECSVWKLRFFHRTRLFCLGRDEPQSSEMRVFIDVYALCILVTREVNGEKDFFKKMQAVQKLDLANPQEGAALAAFKSAIPGLFTDSGKGMYGKNESAFSHFPNAKNWKNNCDWISHTVTTVGAGLNLQINMNIPGSSPVNKLLKLAVSLSCAFLQKFISWITKSYDDSIEAGLPVESAWGLTTKLVECVFRMLNESRPVSDLFSFGNPKQLASTIWLTVEKTHDRIEEFMLKDFKNHSSISGEYIKFLCVRTTTLMH